MIQRSFSRVLSVAIVAGNILFGCSLFAGQLYVGAATVTITPEERVALAGQFGTRISGKIESPCVATALVVETREGDKSLEQAVFVACDLVSIRGGKATYDEVRKLLKGRIPDEVLPKLVLNATHTHTAPALERGSYVIPESGVMAPEEYREYFIKQVAEAIAQAWENRQPAKVAWGVGQAVVAHNRRAVYANGNSVMYGKTDDAKFREIEGSPDHGVELLYFWNNQDQLIATAINVACPAQEVEGRSNVNADFWHQVREQLKAKHGEQLQVVPWCGAGGDQSPHLMYRKAAELRMLKLREITALDELARRVVATWEDVLPAVQKEKHSDVVLNHHIETLQLPPRMISDLEANASKVAADAIKDPNQETRKQWFMRVVKRYEDQQAGKIEPHEMELHAIRLGDIAIATNDFELFTDYGVQMKARSPALQTFVIQLCGRGTYLPTANAIAGGGYSAVPQSNSVGPEGGQVLVDATVEAIKSLWQQEPKVISGTK